MTATVVADNPPSAPTAQPQVDHIVEVRNLSKIYGGEVHALDSINLKFPAGQMTTLLGPSGCGKTTLLKIIAGLLEPSDGQVFINGERKLLGPGDSFYVEPNLDHGAVCRKAGVLLDVFSPVREDFLEERGTS